MVQQTLVVKVAPSEQEALRKRLQGANLEWRTVPHAAFSVRGQDFVATLYSSGKLVIQGAGAEAFLARYTSEPSPVASDRAPGGREAMAQDAVARTDEPTVGADETGKGDYFGPLVVAAVRLEPEEAKRLAQLGVADSKKLSDKKALRLAAGLRELPHAVELMQPEEYNRAYPRYEGLNPMLADLHARAIGQVAKDGDRVLVDQFAGEGVMRGATSHLNLRLEQAHRAERNVAVAAASILARAEFLLALAEHSERWDIELRKGAGAPTDEAALAFVQAHGRDELGQVAKLHFKNTAKLEAVL